MRKWEPLFFISLFFNKNGCHLSIASITEDDIRFLLV